MVQYSKSGNYFSVKLVEETSSFLSKMLSAELGLDKVKDFVFGVTILPDTCFSNIRAVKGSSRLLPLSSAVIDRSFPEEGRLSVLDSPPASIGSGSVVPEDFFVLKHSDHFELRM